jgi:hypothetical protein
LTIFALGALGEFIGAVLLVISLIYVALQIKRNTEVTRAQIMSSGNEFLAQTYLSLMESAAMHPVCKKMVDDKQPISSLSDEERFRWVCWLTAMQVRVNGQTRLLEIGYVDRDQYQRDVANLLEGGYEHWWVEAGLRDGLEANEAPAK